MRPNLLVICGPTASGKTALAVALAQRLNGEVVSADSMQVYKKMDIGTAKIRPEEMQGVKHYLIDCLEPDEDFNVVLFQKMAKDAMEKIYDAGHIPIIAGGTGFYIQALLYDINFDNVNEESEYRKYLKDMADKEGNEVTLIDILGSREMSAEEKVELDEERKLLRDHLYVLDDKESFVLRLRYGLDNTPRKTQREIARQLGISRSYVSRIEKKAVQKLTKAIEAHK